MISIMDIDPTIKRDGTPMPEQQMASAIMTIARQGEQVYIPPGTYRGNDSIASGTATELAIAVNILGAGDGLTHLQDINLLVNGTVPNEIPSVPRLDMHVSGVHWTRATIQHEYVAGVHFSECHFEDCVFTGNGWSECSYLRNRFTKCQPLRLNDGPISGISCRDNLIVNNLWKMIPDQAIVVGSSGLRNRIIGNLFNRVKGGSSRDKAAIECGHPLTIVDHNVYLACLGGTVNGVYQTSSLTQSISDNSWADSLP